MFEQSSTSRTVSPDTTIAEDPSSIPTMFADVPSVPTSFQSLDGVHPGPISTVWIVPICSSGIISGISYVESRQIDLSQGQFGKTGPQRQIIPLSIGLPSYGGPYTLSLSSPEGQPSVSLQQNLGYAGITTNSWVPVLSQQPRVVCSIQQSSPMTNIPTTPAIVAVSQVQVSPVVCQPQVSQVAIQQYFVPLTQPQSATSGMAQVQMGNTNPHLGQIVSVG